MVRACCDVVLRAFELCGVGGLWCCLSFFCEREVSWFDPWFDMIGVCVLGWCVWCVLVVMLCCVRLSCVVW